MSSVCDMRAYVSVQARFLPPSQGIISGNVNSTPRLFVSSVGRPWKSALGERLRVGSFLGARRLPSFSLSWR